VKIFYKKTRERAVTWR